MKTKIKKMMAKIGGLFCVGAGLVAGLTSCEDSDGHALPADFSGTYVPTSGNSILDGCFTLGSIDLRQITPSDGSIKSSELTASGKGFSFVKGKISGKSDTEATFWVELLIDGEKVKIKGTLTVADGAVYASGTTSGACSANFSARLKGAAKSTSASQAQQPQPNNVTYPPLKITISQNYYRLEPAGMSLDYVTGSRSEEEFLPPIEISLTASGGSGNYHWTIGNVGSPLNSNSKFNPAVLATSGNTGKQFKIKGVPDDPDYRGSGGTQEIILTDTTTGKTEKIYLNVSPAPL